MGWMCFGFVHHSRTLYSRAVPNPHLTIRNFCIAVAQGAEQLRAGKAASEAGADEEEIRHMEAQLLGARDEVRLG